MRLMWGGALLLAAFGGCAHEEAASQEYAAPQAQAESQEMRQPVAGHEAVQQPQAATEAPSGNLVLKQQGRFSVKQGEYSSPEGEYFQPQGIYGTKGSLTAKGDIMSQGTFGTYVKREGTTQQPTGVQAQPEGAFYKPFGSSEMSSEKQPVAGHEAPTSFFFVRDKEGHTWQVSNPAVIEKVQQKLRDQGCNPGAVNGKADQQFSRALIEFQQKHGLPATGVVDQATASALGIDFGSLRVRELEHHKAAP